MSSTENAQQAYVANGLVKRANNWPVKKRDEPLPWDPVLGRIRAAAAAECRLHADPSISSAAAMSLRNERSSPKIERVR
jgi:hypothetical protein